MYQIDFNKPRMIHFIGIGGISMSGLAEILLNKGFQVSGSDAAKSKLTQQLEARGVVVHIGQRASNITEDIHMVVYTAAIHPDNPEYIAAVEKGLPMLSRAELLGQIMKSYETAVAVSGTHGKTTTTSMVTEILLAGNYDPTVSVGGILSSIGGNIRVGSSSIFVTEACEYTNSFLSFFPTVEIILNIEEDHLDFFKDIEDIRHSFRLFAEKLLPDDLLIINSDIDHYNEIIKGLTCKVLTCGFDPLRSNYWAENINYDKFARPSFELFVDGSSRGIIELGVTGEHNVYNSLTAIALSEQMGIPLECIQIGLKRFTGTSRRFEKKGELGGIVIIDDYAHVPTEIEANLKVARNYPHEKIWCIFQPHTYTRTKAFLDRFAESLSLADEVILCDIYPARETDDLGVSSMDIAERIAKLGTPVHYIPSFDEIETFVLQHCVNGDLLITMGAGDIVKVGEKLLGL